ncbi:MAG: hypothetical protein SCABRO_01344 [Candidatus Scalindua brodae]|uniref:Uncharacterized protein n=1 Tax=Candidatus Scalindua brodae TaxID=237368 RepID=A0A0B0EQK8_9BACT|nr:MAG: hypothetical protein SCABRO_01344 [Candidatus Scalindua brodae]
MKSNRIKGFKDLFYHLIIPFSGISVGLFIWSMYFSTSSPVFWIFIAIYILYISLFASSFIIYSLSGLRFGDILKRDVYTFLPLLLFLIFPVKDLFTAGTPYYNYLAERYFSGILIIPIGSMVIFLKVSLLTNFSDTPSRSYDIQKKWIYCFLLILACLYAGTFSYYSIIRHINLNTGMDPLGLNSQAVWLLSNFKEPFISYHNQNILADHMVPILFFFKSFL